MPMARGLKVSPTDQLETRLRAVDAVIHNQDNREHDILDSDDYYQFAGEAVGECRCDQRC